MNKKLTVIIIILSISAVLLASDRQTLMDPALLLQKLDSENSLISGSNANNENFAPIQMDLEPASKTEIKQVNFASVIKTGQIDETQSDFTSAGKELRKMRITPPKDDQVEQKRNKMKDIISKLNSIKMPERKVQEKTPEETTKDHNNVDEAIPQQTEPEEQEQDPFEILGYEPISEDTLNAIDTQKFEKLNVVETFEIAEILYKTKNHERAAKFYKAALNKLEQTGQEIPSGKDWIIFQLGNCHKKFDKITSEEYYKKLLMQFPNSPWAQYAKSYYEILKFYNTQKPSGLLKEEVKQDGVVL